MAATFQSGGTDMGIHVIDRLTGKPVESTVGAFLAPGTHTSYLTWSGTGTLSSSGALQGLLTTGTGSVDGDDAHMNDTGLLGTMGFSIANTAAAGGPGMIAASGECDIFRQSDGMQLAGVAWTADLVAILGSPLAAQSSVRLSFADGSLESAGFIIDTPNVFITRTFDSAVDIQGDPTENVGIQIRNPAGGPAAPGASSQDRMVLAGTDTLSPFAGSPVGNTSYFLRTAPVPEPTGLALFALSGLSVMIRRRR